MTGFEDLASILLILIDADRKTLRYASAGHEPAYLLGTDGRVQKIIRTGMPIGVEDDSEWKTVELALAPNDRLIMLTDGLAETASPTGELFGRERLMKVLQDTRNEPLDALPERLINEVTAFRTSHPQTDDITMLAVELV